MTTFIVFNKISRFISSPEVDFLILSDARGDRCAGARVTVAVALHPLVLSSFILIYQ